MSDASPDLAEFLLARIEEDEEQALASKASSVTLGIPPAWLAGVADRVLAECAAKRKIVEMHDASKESYGRWVLTDPDDPESEAVEIFEPACATCATSEQKWRVTPSWESGSRVISPCDTLRALADVYSDHPDYPSLDLGVRDPEPQR